MLDTSALLALRDDEPGAERVAALLQAALSGEALCWVCFLSPMDVLNRIWKDEGERQARLADAQLLSLPIQWVPCSGALLEQAAVIQACHPLSVADAWIAASAYQEGAVLVHKDPAFKPLMADQPGMAWVTTSPPTRTRTRNPPRGLGLGTSCRRMS